MRVETPRLFGTDSNAGRNVPRRRAGAPSIRWILLIVVGWVCLWPARVDAADRLPAASIVRPADDCDGEECAPFVHYMPMIAREYAHVTAPFAPYPADGATQVSLNTFLRWNGNHTLIPPADRVIVFEVRLAAGTEPSADPIAVLSRPALDTATLQADTLYTWQVTAIDREGRRYTGPEWNFTTMPSTDSFGDLAESNIDLEGMVTVPAGEFFMGCDVNNPHDESPNPCEDGTGKAALPLHVVYLDAYEIDTYEVTNSEYAACVEVGVCDPPRLTSSKTREEYYGVEKYALYPVIYVSWQNAQDFCAWEGKRLPTEAEWEKAACGSVDTRSMPWGFEPFSCDRSNYRNSRCDRDYDTLRVGLFPSGMSPYGALDMASNVSEWVQDKLDITYYSWGPYTNPQGSDVSRVWSGLELMTDEWGWPSFVLRGGDFRGHFYYQSTYYRYWGHWGDRAHDDDIPHFRNANAGFRCARSLE